MSKETVNVDFKFYWLLSLTQFLLSLLTWMSHVLDNVVIRMVRFYEIYVHALLQIHLSPALARIPRSIQIRQKEFTVFTANIITYSRTFLIIPIAWSLKCEYSFLACFFVILNALLDNVDGIVARVQKNHYDEKSQDPLFGDFLDIFCDKIINIACLWTILQEIHLGSTSLLISVAFVLLCYTTMAVEVALAIVRVQDYFDAMTSKNKKCSSETRSDVMEGKLKEVIEALAMACLCLSTRHAEPFHHWSVVIGTICLFLTVRFAYGSLMNTYQIRKETKQTKKTVTINATPSVNRTIAVISSFNTTGTAPSRNRAMTLDSALREKEKSTSVNSSSSLQSSPAGSNSSITSGRTPPINGKNQVNPMIERLKEIEEEKSDRSDSSSSSENGDDIAYTFQRSASLPAIWIDGRADKVYTVGCFDLFHEGHRLLLQRMRQFGREVIVGVHDSRSIHKLKSRVPVDGTETRMLNVKRYADQVYCVAGTDPSNFITCVVHLRENETAIYIRGDDMADFPSRRVVEELMPVKFLPYTNGVSSTQLRKELFSHIQSNDLEHLERVN